MAKVAAGKINLVYKFECYSVAKSFDNPSKVFFAMFAEEESGWIGELSAPQQESLNDAKPRISQTINKQFNIGRISRKVTFVLCGSCFWAASYLEGKTAERCQACQSVNIDSIPVAGDEAYIYDYDTKRGIMMDFTHAKA